LCSGLTRASQIQTDRFFGSTDFLMLDFARATMVS